MQVKRCKGTKAADGKYVGGCGTELKAIPGGGYVCPRCDGVTIK